MLFLSLVAVPLLGLLATMANAMPHPHFGGPPPPFGPPPPPHHGGPPMPFPPPPGPPPEYLMDVSEKAHNEHMRLLMENDGMSKAELRNALDKWAESNGVKAGYEKFMEEHEQRRKDYHDLVTANLAGDALAAFNKIWEITEDTQMSRLDECEKMRNVLDDLKVKIRSLVPMLPPLIPCPPPPGCFPPPPPGFGPPPPPNGQHFVAGGEGQGGGQPQMRSPFHRPALKEPKRGKSMEPSDQ